MNTLQATWLLIGLTYVMSATADIMSEPDCMRCLCMVTSNNPDCVKEVCDRQVYTPDSYHRPRENMDLMHIKSADINNHKLNDTKKTPRGPPITHKRPKRSCGPFNLDIHYYTSCGQNNNQNGDVITAFERCATNANCAKSCVRNYTKTFATGCPGTPNCEIWSRTHFGHNMDGVLTGFGCKSPLTLPMWSEVEKCLQGGIAQEREGENEKKLIKLPNGHNTYANVKNNQTHKGSNHHSNLNASNHLLRGNGSRLIANLHGNGPRQHGNIQGKIQGFKPGKS